MLPFSITTVFFFFLTLSFWLCLSGSVFLSVCLSVSLSLLSFWCCFRRVHPRMCAVVIVRRRLEGKSLILKTRESRTLEELWRKPWRVLRIPDVVLQYGDDMGFTEIGWLLLDSNQNGSSKSRWWLMMIIIISTKFRTYTHDHASGTKSETTNPKTPK